MTSSGLLIAGHGSRDDDGVAECGGLVARVRSLAPRLPVALGFIELTPPPIREAVDQLVACGVRDITVVPLVLLGAGHAKTDVPAVIAGVRRDHPDVQFRYGAPLGLHPDLIAIVDERLENAVPKEAAEETSVLLVGRGSSDPDANADLAKVARLVWEGRPYPAVEFAFIGLTGPDVPTGLERCLRLGARKVVVVPYFLFTGLLVRRIQRQALRFAAAHPELAVTVTRHLGVDDRVARLVLHRGEEARAGNAHPNCDLCQYRVALPGFGHRVGAPQTPHPHPFDEPHPHPRDEAHAHAHHHADPRFGLHP